jgi:hypothetical protein
MDKGSVLWEIEQIRGLKARYFRFVDLREDEQFLDVFSDDIEWIMYDENNDGILTHIRGKDEFRQWFGRIADERAAGFTVHHGHTSEIDIIDETHATGIWSVQDYVYLPGSAGMHHIGYGHSHEVYVKDATGQWRIAKLRLTRLHVDNLKTTVANTP